MRKLRCLNPLDILHSFAALTCLLISTTWAESLERSFILPNTIVHPPLHLNDWTLVRRFGIYDLDSVSSDDAVLNQPRRVVCLARNLHRSGKTDAMTWDCFARECLSTDSYFGTSFWKALELGAGCLLSRFVSLVVRPRFLPCVVWHLSCLSRSLLCKHTTVLRAVFFLDSCARELCVAVSAFPCPVCFPVCAKIESDVLLSLVGNTHVSRNLDGTCVFPFLCRHTVYCLCAYRLFQCGVSANAFHLVRSALLFADVCVTTRLSTAFI